MPITDSQWTGLRDRFGDRDVTIDSNGESISRLRVSNTLAVDESTLADRIAQLQSFDRSTFSRPIGVDHDGATDRPVLLSEHVAGHRLTEIFHHASDHGLVPDLAAALFVIRRLLTAVERAQAATGLDHFGIAPGRVIVTPRAEVVVTEAAIAAAVESRIRAGTPAPGAHEDIANIARIGVSMVLGHLITEDHYIDPLSPELADVAEVATIRADETFASVLRLWFEQALVTDRDLSFPNFASAREAFDVADPQSAGCPPSRSAFKAFLTDLAIDDFFNPESARLEASRIRSVRARHLEKHWGAVDITDAIADVTTENASADESDLDLSSERPEPESFATDDTEPEPESLNSGPLLPPEPESVISEGSSPDPESIISDRSSTPPDPEVEESPAPPVPESVLVAASPEVESVIAPPPGPVAVDTPVVVPVVADESESLPEPFVIDPTIRLEATDLGAESTSVTEPEAAVFTPQPEPIAADGPATPEPDTMDATSESISETAAPEEPAWVDETALEPEVETVPQGGWLRRMFHRTRETEDASAEESSDELSPPPAEPFDELRPTSEAIVVPADAASTNDADPGETDAPVVATFDEHGSTAQPPAEEELPSSWAHAVAEPVSPPAPATGEMADTDEVTEKPEVDETEIDASFDVEEQARPSWLRRAFARARDRSEAPTPDPSDAPPVDDHSSDDAPFTFEFEPTAHADREDSWSERSAADPDEAQNQDTHVETDFHPSPTEEPVSEALAQEATVEAVETVAADDTDDTDDQLVPAEESAFGVTASGLTTAETFGSDASTIDTVPHEPPAASAAIDAADETVPESSARHEQSESWPVPVDEAVITATATTDASELDDSDVDESEEDDLSADDPAPAGASAVSSEWIRSAIAQLGPLEPEIDPETLAEEHAWSEIESSSQEEASDSAFDELALADDPTEPSERVTDEAPKTFVVAEAAPPEIAEASEPEMAVPATKSWLSSTFRRIRGKADDEQSSQEPEELFETRPPDDQEPEWAITSDDRPTFQALDSLFAAKAPPEQTSPSTQPEEDSQAEPPTELNETPVTAEPDADAEEPAETYDPIAALMASRPRDDSPNDAFGDDLGTTSPDDSSSIDASSEEEQEQEQEEEPQEEEPLSESQPASRMKPGWLARLMSGRDKGESADVSSDREDEETELVSDLSRPADATTEPPSPPSVPSMAFEAPAPAPPPPPSASTLSTASAIANSHLNRQDQYEQVPARPLPPAAPPRTAAARRASGGWLKAAAVLFLVAGLGYGAYAFRELIPAPDAGLSEGPTDEPPDVATAETPTGGSLTITSTPPGAQVNIDGRSYGVTPLTVADLPPGRHTLLLEGSAGSVRRSVTVRAGVTEEIDEAIYSGFLAVFAPFELDILEQGRRVGTTDSSRIMLPPGRHELELVNTRVSFRETRVVNIRPGETEVINILSQ